MAARAALFVGLYLPFSWYVVPHLAQQFGRVPLPVRQEDGVRPLNRLTVLMNRHYVRPSLRAVVEDAARDLRKRDADLVIQYLDASFPLFNGFPLWPHLSHNDGKKLDIAFVYQHESTGKAVVYHPSWIGYGACEAPLPGEPNMPQRCEEKGYWQYNLLERWWPVTYNSDYVWDEDRTKSLIRKLLADTEIGKIFLEPHLVQRLQIKHNKIRFHGCQAVRHDDHIHIQLR